MNKAPHPLSACMRSRNSQYYQSPQTSIYDDFQTYAQSPQGQLTRADAAAFHARERDHPRRRYEVLEAGVGEGAFALGFLQELHALDRASGADLAARVHYTLMDFSKPMLEKAYARLHAAGLANQVDTREWDACDADALPLIPADWIRCNELFSDLPADAYSRSGEALSQALYDEQLKAHLAPAEWGELDELERKLLLALPPDYILPLNRTALLSIEALTQNLKPSGRLQIFDYGFYNARDFDLPAPIWNETVVRDYHSQWTVDLNFIYLSAALASAGFEAEVQPQEKYVQRWLGSATPAPIDSEDASDGLSYAEDGVAGVEEDDAFYHLEVGRP